VIQTVLGEVSPDDLGMCLPHEHIFIDLYRVYQPHREMILNDLDLAVSELQKFADAGGRTLIEVTTPDISRDAAALKKVAQRTGINIVMGTGRHREPFYEQALWQMSTKQIAAQFIAEIDHGVDGIRAGIIGEIGTDLAHISPAEERVHRAAALASIDTGLSITTHSNATPVGMDQLDLFIDCGVDPSRIVIGHCDTYPFIDHHLALLKRGAWVQYDTIRGTFEYQTKRAIQGLKQLIEAGYLEQLLISQDTCVDRHLTVYGGEGYAYLITKFREELRDNGISDEQFEILTIHNPRRMLGGGS
jgi:predicted metal-dependent phosphotriesterase family hydrolase